MAGNYWGRVLARRLSRRRALASTGGAAAASAFLIACGGDDDDGSTGSSTGVPSTGPTGSTATGGSGPTGSTGGGSTGSTGGSPSSGLVTAPLNETASAKSGGTMLGRATFEPRSHDPHQFPHSFYTNATYSNLFRVSYGVEKYSDGEIEGDLVASWETSPDLLTITAKLNPDARFAPVAPIDGRPVDANDVAASWQRYIETSNQRADFASSVNPSAPISSIEAIDDGTIAIKLAAPNAVVTSRLARHTPGSMYIVPKEGLDPAVLDLQTTSVGSGPFYVSEHTPSVALKLKRNPGYTRDSRGFPFLDELHYPLVQEYSTFMSQFRAGNLHLGDGIAQEDIVLTKNDVPELEIMSTYFQTLTPRLGFGVAPDSLFVDERLRQAFVLTLDRELLLSTIFNREPFAAQGLDITIAMESGLQANTFAGWLLDPLSSEFGPNSKFFQQDFEEAKKLIEAAGFPGVVEGFQFHYAAPEASVPTTYSSYTDAIVGLAQDSGLFKWDLNVVQNYRADFVPKYHNQATAPFSGVAISLSNLSEDPANYLFTYYSSRGTLRMGTDDRLDELTTKAVAEFDAEARMALVHEIQVYEGGKNFFPRFGGGTGFSLAWLAVRNREVYQGGTGLAVSQSNAATLWLDQTKAPFV
jgi:ABC-type transport system substrate-binding protein